MVKLNFFSNLALWNYRIVEFQNDDFLEPSGQPSKHQSRGSFPVLADVVLSDLVLADLILPWDARTLSHHASARSGRLGTVPQPIMLLDKGTLLFLALRTDFSDAMKTLPSRNLQKRMSLSNLRRITYQHKWADHRSIHRYPDTRFLHYPAVCNQGNTRTAQRTDSGTRYRFL